MSQYIFTATKGPVTWTQAAERAVTQGGQLASINTAEENAFVLAVLAQNANLWHYDPRDNAQNGPWIGLFQPEGSPEPAGGWTWLDGTPVDFRAWHSTQPDNFLGGAYGHYWSYQEEIGWSDHLNEPDIAHYGPIQSYITEFADAAVRLTGSVDDDYIYGGGIANVIKAGKGSDWINGGGGADTLYGGNGKDRFVYDSEADANGDVIMDLDLKDKIDLSAIDANLGREGNQAFKLAEAFSGKAGQLVMAFDGTQTTFSGDNNGDGVADFMIAVIGDWSADFLVM